MRRASARSTVAAQTAGGGSRGQVKVSYQVEPHADGSQVTLDAAVTLSGAAAQFGRTGIIKEMSNRLLSEFVQCVEAKLAAISEEEAAAVEAGEVGGIGLVFLQSGIVDWQVLQADVRSQLTCRLRAS